MPQHRFITPIVVEVLDSRVQRDTASDRRGRQLATAQVASVRHSLTVVRHEAQGGDGPPDDWAILPPPSFSRRASA
jgi:hypothetical protein